MIKTVYGFCLLTFLSIAQFAFGQVPEPMKNITTPNVASLGTYGDTPVDMYTGQPNITVPLYEIVEGDMKIPLYLRYSLSEVKPNNHPSWVSMGWNLSCGGQITRAVRGCMDEKKCTNGYAPGFYAHCRKIKEITSLSTLLTHQDYYMHDIEKDGYELSADEFSFNFCGYSGRFYLNGDGEWTVVSDDDIKVIFDEKEGFIATNQLRKEILTDIWSQKRYCNRFFNQFTLITPDGTQYTFGGQYATEYSIPYYNQNNSDLIPTTWLLSKVKNTEGKVITLEYEAGTPVCELKYAPWDIFRGNIVCSGNNNENQVGYNGLSGFLLFPVYLHKVTTTFTTVNFHTRQETGETKLNSLFLVLPNNRGNTFSPYGISLQEVPRFDVFFKNVYSSILNTYRKNLSNAMIWKRLYAVEVHHNREDSIGNRTFYFDYSMGSGDGNHSLLRCISERKGSYREYVEWVHGGGMLLKFYKFPDYPSDYTPKEYHFEYNFTQRLPEPMYGVEDHWGYWNGQRLLFSETAASLITRKYASQIYATAETLKAIIYPTGGKSEFSYESNAYSQKVSPSFTSIENKAGFAGGLRIAEIKVYHPDGQLERTKKYYYTKNLPTNSSPSLSESSGILKSEPVYETVFSTTGQPILYRIKIVRFEAVNDGIAWLGLRNSGGFIVQSTNDDTPNVGYSSVFEETIDANGKSQGYVHYRYSNYDRDIWGETHLNERFLFATASGQDYADHYSSKSMERGKLMSEEYYNSDKRKLKSILYKYRKENNTVNEYLTTVHQQVIFFCNDGLGTTYGILSSAFKTFTYSYMLAETFETIYDETGKSVEKKTEYFYNRHKLLAEKVVYNSNGNKYKEKSLYSCDLVQANIPIYAEMVNKHILNAIIINTQVGNGHVTGSSCIKYGQVADGSYKPIVLYRMNTAPAILENELENPLESSGVPKHSAFEVEKEFYYDGYSGNVSSIKDKNGIYTSYLWGYKGRYPIVEIQNANLDELMQTIKEVDSFLLFEPREPALFIEVIDAMAQKMPKAHISIYDYIPMVGILSFCNSNGDVEHYEYDELGRLLRVKDKEGNVIQESKYSYHNAQK